MNETPANFCECEKRIQGSYVRIGSFSKMEGRNEAGEGSPTGKESVRGVFYQGETQNNGPMLKEGGQKRGHWMVSPKKVRVNKSRGGGK